MKLNLIIIVTILSACSDRVDNKTEKVNFAEILPTQIYVFRGDVLVDSSITIVPLTQNDTLHFVSINFDYLIEINMQKKIFELKRIRDWTSHNSRLIDFWFTRCANKSDSTKDVAIYSVLRKGKVAVERYRFRYNLENEIASVSNCPICPDFVPIESWKADTIPKDE